MNGCQKKVTRRPPNKLEEELVVDCDASADRIAIGNAITILVCGAHHVEIVDALHAKLRHLRRLEVNVMALVAGYGSNDIDISDIEDVLDAVEGTEDEIRAEVKTWMAKPQTTTENAR